MPFPQTSTPFSEYADLDQFGLECRPEYAFQPGLDTLANGDYDCRLGPCRLDRIQDSRVVRASLHVAGRVIEYVWWLNRLESVNRFLADMLALGFPAATWGSRPGQTLLSESVPTCVGRLEGISFRATKSSRKDSRPGQDKTYHELYISGTLAVGSHPGSLTAGTSPAALAAAPGTSDSSDIPF